MKHQCIEVTFTSAHQYITHIMVYFLRSNRLRILLPSALLLFSFSHPVLAVVFGKVLQPYASYGLTADDNILRIRDNTDPISLLRSPVLHNAFITGNLFDFSHRFTGGLIFEKEISRQRLSANFNWTHQFQLPFALFRLLFMKSNFSYRLWVQLKLALNRCRLISFSKISPPLL